MVLADDNFATIVHAVEEGRKVYDNVRKVLQFQLTTNLAEIVSIFLASMLGFRLLNAAHLLWINLVTDSAPGLALGMEKAEAGIMQRKPRPMTEGLFAGGAAFFMSLQGVFMGLLILFSYFIGERLETGVWGFNQSDDGMTMALLTCNFVEMFRAFSSRSITGSIFNMKTRNMWLWGAFAWTFVLTCGVIFVPVLRGLFGFTAINLQEFLIALAMAFTIIPVTEVVKAVQRARMKKTAG
jgi:Ca2+-transporting ATPase